MSVDWISVLIGVVLLPALAATVWATLRLKMLILHTITRSAPSTVHTRVRLGAQVFAAHRVLVLRFRDTAVAFTLGYSHANEQRAAAALSAEFVPTPASGLRAFW
jgi:hypothetical protein